jgi:hypothetical protein
MTGSGRGYSQTRHSRADLPLPSPMVRDYHLLVPAVTYFFAVFALSRRYSNEFT